MLCPKCGSEVDVIDEFCWKCGLPIRKTDEDKSCLSNLQNDNVQEQSAQTKESHKKSIIAVVVTLSVIALTILSIVVFNLISEYNYHNSDEYKLMMAGEKVNDGNYNEGLSYIGSITSSEANAIKQFVSVLECRDEFEKVYNNEELIDSSSTVYKRAEDLIEAINDFEESKLSYYLPESLQGKYEKYSDAVETAEEICYYSNLRQYIYDMQIETYDFYMRKTGSKFTYGELKQSYNTGKNAYDSINVNIIAQETYSEFAIIGYCRATDDLSIFIDSAYEKITSDEQNIEKFKGNSDDHVLEYTEINPDYVPWMGSQLLPITSYSNIDENSDKLAYSIECGMLAYKLGIETID